MDELAGSSIDRSRGERACSLVGGLQIAGLLCLAIGTPCEEGHMGAGEDERRGIEAGRVVRAALGDFCGP